MGAPLGLQFSIALCAGMVAATFAPAIRRTIPRWFEIALWVALIFVCWFGIASIRDPHTRELTDSVNWALSKIFGTLLGLAGTGVFGILSANRYPIANAVVTLFGADLLAVALMSTYREGRGWQPRVRLRDWMEVPTVTAPALAAAPVGLSGIDELNERWSIASASAGAAAANWSAQFLIWARDVGLPRAEERLALAVAVGRVETRVWLQSVRETALELESEAQDFYTESGPEINKLALRVAAILNGVTDAEQRTAPGVGKLAQVVDIQALRIAQTFGRLGRETPTDEKDEKEEEIGPEHSDQLAS